MFVSFKDLYNWNPAAHNFLQFVFLPLFMGVYPKETR